MKHLNVKKTILILAVLSALCLLFTGCARVVESISEVKEAVSDAVSPRDSAEKAADPNRAADGSVGITVAPVIAVSAPRKQISDEELTAAFERMLQKGTEAVENNDFETFRTVYTGVDDEYLKNEWNGFKNGIVNHEKHVAALLWRGDDMAMFGCTFYTVAGVHPNTTRSSTWYYLCMKMQDGEGRMFKPSQEEMNVLQAGLSEGVMELYFDALGADADAAREARDAGHNFALFDEPWLLSRSDMVFEGCSETPRIMMAWQEANGDVKVLLWSANGTSQNIANYNIRIELEDRDLGPVFDYALSGDFVVKSGRNSCCVITVPADRVLTGTAAWGSLRGHINNNFR